MYHKELCQPYADIRYGKVKFCRNSNERSITMYMWSTLAADRKNHYLPES